MLEVQAARRDGYPLISGHRGAGAYAPENTLAAFRKGLEVGADLLELDVQLCRDGHVVIMHDSAVDRTTDGHGAVADLTLAELQRLDAGGWFGAAFAGERVPTLDAVAGWAAGRIRLNIELKGFPAVRGDLPERVAAICRRHGISDQTLIISFDHVAIRRIKEADGALAVAINYGIRLADPVGAARAAMADVLNTTSALITPEFCALAHANGLGVQCFMDDPVGAAKLAAMGTDFMDSDRPDVVRAAVRGARG